MCPFFKKINLYNDKCSFDLCMNNKNQLDDAEERRKHGYTNILNSKIYRLLYH